VDPLIVMFGLAVGILVGLTGIGGGSLMTPVLILVFGFTPVTAIGTDLAYGAVTKTVGGFKHLRQRTVDLRVAAWMAVGSVPAAFGGLYVLHALERAHGEGFDDLLIGAVGVALLITGAAVLGVLLLPKLVSRERLEVEMTASRKLAAVLVGVFVGFVLGVTSAGSGALIAVALILVFRLFPTRVVGTDVFHAAVLLWAAAAGHIIAGNVDYALAGTILLGSVPGVWLGSHWAVRIPVSALRATLAAVLVGAGLALLSKSGVSVPPALIPAVPLALLVLLGARERWRQSRLPLPAAGGPAADQRAFADQRAV
jgi:uncharacterized membrane protein YfcA